MPTPNNKLRAQTRRPKSSWWALALILLFPLPTSAQEEVDELLSMTLEQLMDATVITPSRVPESIFHAPGQVIVITRNDIRTRGYRSLDDLLRDLPSTDIQRYSGQIINRIQLRGITGQNANDQFLVLLNGHRINEPTNSTINISENFPIYMAHQVEIVYGPYSSLYGSDALSGAINIITQSATQSISASAESGSHGYRRGETLLSGTNNQFHWQVGGHYTESDNRSRVQQFPQAFQLTDLQTFSGAVAVPAQQREPYRFPLESWGIFGHAQLHNSSAGLWHSSIRAPSWAGDAPHRVNYNANAFRDQNVTTVWFDQDWTATDNLDIRFATDYSRGILQPESLFNNIFTEYKNGHVYQLSERHHAEARAIYTKNGWRWISGGMWQRFHAISAHADLSIPFDPDKPISEQGAYYLGTNNTLKAKVFDANYFNYGFFSELVRQWTDRFRISAGIRYEDHSLSERSLAPRVSLNYRPTNRSLVKLLYGQAFKSPSPHTIYEHFGAFSGQQNDQGLWTSFFFRVRNPDLRPEESQTLEMTFVHFPAQTFSWTASGYFNHIKKAISTGPTPTTASDFIPGGIIFDTDTNLNLGSLKTWGLSLGAKWQHKTSPHSQLTLWGYYDWLDGEEDHPLDNAVIDIPYTSKHKLKAGIEWTRSGFSIASRFYWIQDANTPESDPTDTNFGAKISGYQLFNANISWTPPRSPATFYIRADNLLNKKYVNVGGGGSSTFFESPQDGRWIQLGIQISK